MKVSSWWRWGWGQAETSPAPCPVEGLPFSHLHKTLPRLEQLAIVNMDHRWCKDSHHGSRGRVMVVTANVTLPIIGPDNACQPSIQGYMGLGVSGKHQQVGCIVPPANLLLLKKKKKGKWGKATLVTSLAEKKNQEPPCLKVWTSRLREGLRTIPVLRTQNGTFQFAGSCSLRKTISQLISSSSWMTTDSTLNITLPMIITWPI